MELCEEELCGLIWDVEGVVARGVGESWMFQKPSHCQSVLSAVELHLKMCELGCYFCITPAAVLSTTMTMDSPSGTVSLNKLSY